MQCALFCLRPCFDKHGKNKKFVCIQYRLYGLAVVATTLNSNNIVNYKHVHETAYPTRGREGIGSCHFRYLLKYFNDYVYRVFLFNYIFLIHVLWYFKLCYIFRLFIFYSKHFFFCVWGIQTPWTLPPLKYASDFNIIFMANQTYEVSKDLRFLI